MSSFTSPSTLLHAQNIIKLHHQSSKYSLPLPIKASTLTKEHVINRRKIVTFFATSLGLAQFHGNTLPAMAENWGTHSFLKERFFEPDLSPEDSVARIRQTAEGLHSIREMLENMSWRYVLFYIRLKQAYLSKDLKIAMSTLPPGRRKEYIKMANELVDNMALFDSYVRTPKVYESYIYYEKSLKNIDDIVAMFV